MKDEIYKYPPKSKKEEAEKFEFSKKVAQVFDDMISRSVPYYEANQKMTAEMALEFYQPESMIYDLGCSTGKSAWLLSETFLSQGFKYLGLDTSPWMLEKARALAAYKNFPAHHQIEFAEGNVENFSYENTGVIIANYTFQFIAPNNRLDLLKKLYSALLPGGIILLSEKVAEDDQVITEHFTNMHHRMKKRHGYSDQEIIRKRDALENVLIPNKTEENLDLLKKAGFKAAAIYHKWYNFASYLAIKL